MANRGKPGELSLACGLLLLLGAPLVLAILNEQDGQLAELAASGVVAEARVTGHHDEEEQYTRKGRTRTRTNHFLDLAFDLNARTPYGQWRDSGEIQAGEYPAMVTGSIDVGESLQEQHEVGANVPVVFIPGQSDGVMLVAEMQHRTSWAYHLWHYVGSGVAMLVGLGLLVSGWRKRFPRTGARG